MDKKMLGSLVSYERNRKKIGMQQLVEGVCSVAALQRLENGERVPDYFVLERILERLGKSINKVEFLYDEKVYEIYYLRELIEHHLEKKEYESAVEALAYYESLPESRESLHKQYISKIKGIVLSERDDNHVEAALILKLALEETVFDFVLDDIENFLLGEEELTLVILWMKEVWMQNEIPLTCNPEKLFSYIEQYCDDEEIKINVYTKASWLIGSYYIHQSEYKEALRYTLKGQKVLADNVMLLHMPEFLERILDLLQISEDAAYDTWKKQRDALKYLYDEYNRTWAEDTITLWKNYRQQELYLFSEVFVQERKRLNLSQERLADALEIDQKTISRIESGKYKPKAGTLNKMRYYLQIERDVCTTRIVVDDFHLLEMEREIARLNSDGRETEAENLFLELKPKLSLEWKENQQYIKFQEAVYDNRLRGVSEEKTIEICLDAFRITRPGVDVSEIEQMKLSRLEVLILNFVAICYAKTNNKHEAVEILQRIVRGYEHSKVDLKRYYAALGLIYQHIAGWSESIGLFEQALLWCDRTIQFNLDCERGLGIGYMYAQKCFTLQRYGKIGDEAKEIYKKAYQILKLMNRNKKMISLQKSFHNWYGEEIDT